jgi:hypothetical protein
MPVSIRKLLCALLLLFLGFAHLPSAYGTPVNQFGLSPEFVTLPPSVPLHPSTELYATIAAQHLDVFSPGGPKLILPAAEYTKSAHGWVSGNHPAFTAQQHAQMEEMLVCNKQSFAYGFPDLPGYHGTGGVFEVQVNEPDKPC